MSPKPDAFELDRWFRSRPLPALSIDVAGMDFTDKPAKSPWWKFGVTDFNAKAEKRGIPK